MDKKISLTNQQELAIKALYDGMKASAISLGNQLIELETVLDAAFSDKSITMNSLSGLIGNIESVRAELRIVHLSTHLKPDILSTQPVALYNELRGYFQDPCENIPRTFSKDVEKHNGCE